MSRSPALSGLRLIKILRRHGFEVVRQKRSHRFLRHPDGRCTVVPVHKGETIGRGLLASILKDCDLTQKDIRSKS